MKSLEEAEHLSETMVSLGREVGRETIAVITDMSQPLGRAIGTVLKFLKLLKHLLLQLARRTMVLLRISRLI